MTSRNAPCTCGSGKKYKRCCGAGEKSTGKRTLLIGIGMAAVVLLAIGFGLRETESESEPTRVIGSPSASGLPQRQGQPWEYDAATGSHWDPAHGHWHQGPPPANRTPGTAPGTVETGNTPAPWEYDATRNQHWDPEHGHWHDGPPPER